MAEASIKIKYNSYNIYRKSIKTVTLINPTLLIKKCDYIQMKYFILTWKNVFNPQLFPRVLNDQKVPICMKNEECNTLWLMHCKEAKVATVELFIFLY